MIGGIEETPYAWHGTSVQAIEYLAEHGHLPATGTYGNEFFYAPESLQPGLQEGHASHYAAWNGAKQYILEHLPFVPQDREAFMYALDSPERMVTFLAEAKSHGVIMTEHRVEDMWNEATRLRKGVIVGISSDIAQDYEEDNTQDVDQCSVTTVEGLSLRYITGIEPQGDFEWEWLVALQERVNLVIPHDSDAVKFYV